MCGVTFDTTALTEVLFDDIQDLSVRNGIFRCTLYALQVIPPAKEPVMVPVLRLALPVSEVGPIAQKALTKVAADTIRNVIDFTRGETATIN